MDVKEESGFLDKTTFFLYNRNNCYRKVGKEEILVLCMKNKREVNNNK